MLISRGTIQSLRTTNKSPPPTHTHTYLANGVAGAFVRHAWVHVAVEHDGGVELGRDGAVKVHHAEGAVGSVGVAGVPIFGVGPPCGGTGPRTHLG